ncbi:MAG: hypothetical protein JNL25_04415 [Rhodospirillaceae bacterium]|nr:hypothetical protein [Rhodospirillaceae bacterium]
MPPETVLLFSLTYLVAAVAGLSALRLMWLFVSGRIPEEAPARSIWAWLATSAHFHFALGIALLGCSALGFALGPVSDAGTWSFLVPLIALVLGMNLIERATKKRRLALRSWHKFLTKQELRSAAAGDQMSLVMLVACVCPLLVLRDHGTTANDGAAALAQSTDIGILNLFMCYFVAHSLRDPESDVAGTGSPRLRADILTLGLLIALAILFFLFIDKYRIALASLEGIDLGGLPTEKVARTWSVYLTVMVIVEGIAIALMLCIRTMAAHYRAAAPVGASALAVVPALALTWFMMPGDLAENGTAFLNLATGILAGALLGNIGVSYFNELSEKINRLQLTRRPILTAGWCTVVLFGAILLCTAFSSGVAVGFLSVVFVLMAASYVIRNIA